MQVKEREAGRPGPTTHGTALTIGPIDPRQGKMPVFRHHKDELFRKLLLPLRASQENDDMDTQGKSQVLTSDFVSETLGDMGEDRIAAILATGATREDFEVAVAWAAGESDVMGDLRKPLSGGAAAVYDLLMQDEWEDDRRTE